MKVSIQCIFLLLFATLGNAYPNTFQCSRYCKEDWNKFGYEVGLSYEYSYVGDIRTLVNSSDANGKNQETGLILTANVVLSVESNCDFILKVKGNLNERYVDKSNNIRVKEADLNDEFNTALSEHPLYFSFQNGRIETICPSDKENKEILNVKKAILSAFQNSIPNFEEDAVVYETDISGNCETQYEIKQGQSFIQIAKKKNLEACSHRKSKDLSWLSVPYSKTTTKSQSLLRSTQTCNQILNDKTIIKLVECDETHLFQPFSNNENGAKVLIKQQLELISISNTIGKSLFPTNYHHESLLPIYNKNSKTTAPSIDTILEILTQLDVNTVEGVEKQVPKIFLQLVNYIRESDYDTMQELFEMVKDFPRQKKFLLDSMSLVTTLDGIRVIKELYKNGEINENHLNSWLTSIAFMKNPTSSIISALAPLMKHEKRVGQKAVLTISTLIHIYCKEDSKCMRNLDIIKTIKMIEEPISIKCAPTSEEVQDRIILTLKAIGNIGFTTSLNNLRKCYSNNDIPIEIQLAAIASHRRINCADNNNLDEFLDYFADPRKQTEIRIASYLATMQCLSYTTFTRIRDVLRNEETNQVGSFVWTHLTNLQETSSRWKQNLKSLVENEFLRNKFSTDMRKYSRNYETSMFFDSINTGATVESNLVFTSESYLPKSLMLNLTLDLFGEAVNLFEFGGRIEGFEQVVENLFGPEGYFPEETIKRLLEDVRGERTHHEKIEQLGNTFASQNILKKNPSGMWYAKMFGNELTYTRFNDLESFIGGPINTGNILKALMNIFREQDVDYNKSFLFIDSACQIPTLIGFPLQLIANGVATVGFTVKGQLDVKDLWSRKLIVEGKVYPSASVEITGSLTIDGIVTKTGLKSVQTLNSNTYLDGHIFIDDGKIVDLKLNVPKKEMNIINIDSIVYLFQNDSFIEMQDVSKNVEKLQSCTPKSISTIIGFEVCQDLKYVNASMDTTAPYFPLTGKFAYSLDIRKTDQFDSYNLLFKTQTIVNKYRPLYSMSFYFDTPNSRINRKINASYQLDFENLSLKAELTSPFANLKIKSKIGDDYDKLNFILQTLFNNREIIYLKTALKSSNVNSTWRYQPLLKLNYKEKQIVSVSGNVDYIKGSEYKSNLKIDCFNYDTIAIIGRLFHFDDKYSMSASVHSREIHGDVFGELLIKFNRINITTTANYNFNKLNNQKFIFNLEGHRTQNVNFSEDFLHFKLHSTQKPFYNSELLMSSYRRQLFMKNNGMLSVFGITWNTEQLFKFHKQDEYYDVALKCDLICKQRNVDYKIALVHNASSDLFLLHGLLQLNRIKRIELLTDYKRNYNQNRTLTFLFYFPRQAWMLNGTLTEQRYNEHKFMFYGARESDDQQIPIMLIKGTYTNVTTSESEHYKINGTLDTPDVNGKFTPNWKITSLLEISNSKFVNINNIETTAETYVSHISWSPESFNCVIQINEKQIIVLNGVKKDMEIDALLSLNFYQHFEWSMNIILPYEKFAMALYWDKDRDLNQKMTLFFIRNAQRGLYNAVLEYPNQKITASVVFLPTQITLNVTWGMELSQRIFLKAGNKVYEIGGVWFAKLETPFEYLESQEFQLSYYILPKNAELKMDVSWRNQKINLIISGIRSDTHLSGYIEVNTTITEISKINVAITHSRSNIENLIKIKNDINLIFNSHHITGQSLWESTGLNVTAAFDIISPSNTIEPLIGSLIMKNNQTTNLLNGSLSWKNERIAIDYQFENSHSYIKILTPFEGIEETDFDYIVIGEADTLILEVKSKFLRQYNYALLSWKNEALTTNSQIKVICPFIGQYNIQFKHSTIFGHFEEYFIVTQGEINDIISFQLFGDFIPIFEADINANINFLHHRASFLIRNTPKPIGSFVEFHWDDNYVNGSLLANVEHDTVKELHLNISSSLTDDIDVKYTYEKSHYVLTASLPNGYKLHNTLKIINLYNLIENQLNISTPNGDGSLFYIHDLTEMNFNHRTIIRIGKNISRFILYYNMNDKIDLIDEFHMELETPWYHPFIVNFSMPYQYNLWKPNLNLIFDNDPLIKAKAEINYHKYKSNVFITCDILQMNTTRLNLTYDFLNNNKNVHIEVERMKDFYEINADFTGDILNNLKLIGNMKNRNLEQVRNYIDTNIEYSFDQLINIFKVYVKFPQTNTFYNLQIASELDFNIFKANANFTSTLSTWENIQLNTLISLNPLNQNAIINFNRNDKSIQAAYKYMKHSNFSSGNLKLLSDFQLLTNASAEFIYKFSNQYQSIELNGEWAKRHFTAIGNYKINTKIDKDMQEITLDSALKIVYYPGKYNFDTTMKGFLINRPKSGQLSALFNSNFESIQSINLIGNYSITSNGYNLGLTVDHNRDLYHFEHSLINAFNILEMIAKLETPQRLKGDAFGHLLCKKIGKQIEGSLQLKRHLESYNFTLNTTWNGKLLGNFEMNTASVNHAYNGYVKINYSGINGTIDILLNDKKSNRKMQMHLLTDETIKFDLNSNLNWFKLEPIVFYVNYENHTANMYFKCNYPINLNGTIDGKNARIEIVFANVTGSLVGSHTIDSIENLSFAYTFIILNQISTINIVNKVDQVILTTIDVYSTIKDFGDCKFESKLSRNKIELDFKMQNYNFEFVVDKNVLNPKFHLLIEGDKTIPLSLSVHRNQLRALSNTHYGQHHFEINSISEKYSVLYKRNHKKIFFIDLYDIEIDGQLKFKSNFGSVVFEENKNLTMTFSLRYFPQKTLLFSIYNLTDVLFHIKTGLQLDKPHCMAKLELSSTFHALQMLSVSFLLHPLEELQLHFARKEYYRETIYNLIIVIPSNRNETKFTIIFPDDEYQQWTISFATNQSRVDFLLKTPWDNLQHISFQAQLEKLSFNGMSTGFVKFKRNEFEIDSIWHYAITDHNIIIDWDLTNTPFFNTTHVINGITFKAIYQFENEIEGVFDFNQLDYRGNLSFKHNEKISLINGNITSPYFIRDLTVDLRLKDRKGHFYLDIGDDFIIKLNGRDVKNDINRDFLINATFQNFKSLVQIEYDYNSPKISLITDLNVYDYILMIKSNLQSNLNLTNGNLVAIITNGYIETEPKADEYGFAWLINNDEKSAKIAFQKNSEISYIEFDYNIERNQIKSSGVITCGNKSFKLNLEGIVNKGNTSIIFLIGTPLENFRELTLKTNFIKTETSYEIQSNLGWPNRQTMEMYLLTTYNNKKSTLQLTFLSPFSKRLHTTLELNLNGNQLELITLCSMGGKEIEFKGKINPKLFATFDLKSPFAGYTTANFTTIFDPNLHTLSIYFQKEMLTTEFHGIINTTIDNVYEIVMSTTNSELHSNEPYGKIVIKFDSNNMKGSADVYWKNEEIDVDIGFNPKNMYLHIDSPFELIRNVRVQGQYEYDINSHNINSQGIWNKVVINFSGTLIMKENSFIVKGETEFGKDYHGYINYKSIKNSGKRLIVFDAYYPNKSSDVALIFQSETIKTSTNSQLTIKTPFEFIKHLNSETIISDTNININTLINIMDDDLKLKFKTYFQLNQGNFTFDLNVPQIESKWIIASDLSTSKGYIQLNYGTNVHWDNFTLDYKIENSQLISHYVIHKDDNIKHTAILSWRNHTQDTKYALLIDQYGVEYKYNNKSNNIIRALYLHIPSLLLTNIKGRFECDYVLDKYNMFATYEGNQINMASIWGKREITTTGVFHMFQRKITLENVINILEDSIYITNNITDGKIWLYTKTEHVNNQKIYEIKQILINNYDNFDSHFYLEKSLDKIFFDIKNLFKISIQYQPHPELYLFVNDEKTNELKISLVPDNIFLKIVAPTLSPLVNTEVRIESISTLQYCQIDLYFSTENNLIFHNKAKLYFADAGYIVNIDLFHRDERILLMSGEIDITNITKGSFELKIFDTSNSIFFILNTFNPYLGGLSIKSPFFKYNGITLEAGASENSLFLFVGSGPAKLRESLLIEPEKHDKYLYIQGKRQDKIFIVQIEAPSSSILRYFNFQANIDTIGPSVTIDFTGFIEIKSELIGNLLIDTKFNVNPNGVDSELHLNQSFIESFHTFDIQLRMPFSYSLNFNPRVLIGFPNNRTYLAYLTYKNVSKELLLSAGYQWDSKKLHTQFSLLKMFIPSIFAEIHLPIQTNNRYVLSLSGLQDFNNEDDHSNYLEIFEKKYELIYAFCSKPNKYIFKVDFNLPDNYYFNFIYKNGEEKIMKAIALYPSLLKEIGFECKVSSQRPQQLKLQTKIALPFEDYSLNYGELYLFHDAILNDKNRTYIVDLNAKINTFTTSLDLKAGLDNEQVFFNLNTTLNKERFATKLKLVGNVLSDIDFLFIMQTPLKSLKDIQLFLLSSNEIWQELRFGFIFNSKTVIHTQFTIIDDQMVLNIDNMWRPLSITYLYVNDKSFKTFISLCWNTTDIKHNEIGAYLNYNKNISAGLILPTRSVRLNGNYFISNQREYYFGDFYWNQNDGISLHREFSNITNEHNIRLNSIFLLELPFTTLAAKDYVEINSNIQIPSVMTTLSFQWGKRNYSIISLTNLFKPCSIESKLSIPPLENDLILTLSRTPDGTLPSRFKAEFQYASELDKKVEFEMLYDRSYTDVYKMERKFAFKHIYSKIDYALQFKTIRTPEYTTGDVVLEYVNYLIKQREKMKCSLKIGHEKFDVAGELRTTKSYVNFAITSRSGPNHQDRIISLQVNDKEPLILNGRYNFQPMEPSLLISSSYGDNRKYDFYAGIPSKREITTKLVHEIYNNQIIDGLFTMKLNTSQILWIKMLWKNELLSEFKTAVLQEYNDLRFIIEATGQQLIDVIHDDFGQNLFKDIFELQKNISTYATNQSIDFKEHYNQFIEESLHAYQQNAFYSLTMQNISSKYIRNLEKYIKVFDSIEEFLLQIYKGFVASINNTITSIRHVFDIIHEHINGVVQKIKAIKSLKSDAKEILRKGIDEARKSLNEMDILVVKLINKSDEIVNGIRMKYDQFLEPYLKLFDDLVVYVEQRLAFFQMMILDILDTVQQYILNLRESREILQVYISYINWLEELHLSEILDPIADTIEAILETIITDVEKIIDEYKPYFDALSNAIFGNYQEINKLPPLTEFREYLSSFYQRILWIWNYHNLSQVLKTHFHKLISDLDDFLSSFFIIENSNTDFENVLGQSDYIFRPDMGIIEVSQPLPVEWEAFDQMPIFEQHPLYQKIKRKVENLLQLQRHRYIDFINIIKSYVFTSPTSLLSPPTNNIGMLIGTSHYITFDKKYYKFSGECSYLLASDFIANTFSIIVNYQMNNTIVKKRSLSVISEGNELEISRDIGVSLNGHRINLPLFIESLTVVQHNSEIIIENFKGMKTICNLHYDYCTVQLSGWLFGKTGGLLGTLDNERSTDMSLPDGYQTSNLMEFVQSWQIGTGKCTDINHANDTIKTNISPLSTTLFDTLCQVFFVNSNSPFGRCFSLVDPKPYYDICLSDMKDSVNPSICSSLAAYKAQCEGGNVLLEMPEMCVHCSNGVAYDEKILDGNNPKSIDVIFIIEDNCFTSNTFSTLPQYIDENLKLQGFTKNRFASIGYGSNFNKPYSFIHGKHFWTNSNIKLNLTLNGTTHLEQKITGLDAINFAISKEFRPGVSKLFILMQCESPIGYEQLNRLHNILGDKDVTLHILKKTTPSDLHDELLELGRNDHILYYNPGYNSSNLNVQTMSKSMDWNTKEVTDSYMLLGLSTNGTILNIHSESDSKLNNMEQLWAHVISQSAKRSPCQKCKCVKNSDDNGKIECNRCLSPSVKQLLQEYESNGMAFKSVRSDENFL